MKKLWLVLAAGSAAVLLLPASAQAGDVTCTSAQTTPATGNLIVPAGQFCVLGANVTGNVTVYGGLQAFGPLTIGGNVQGNHAGQIGLSDMVVDGNLQADQTAGGSVCSTHILGDLQIANSLPPGGWNIGCGSSAFVGGNVQLNNNAETIEISSSDIEHNLQCNNNTPQPTDVGGNFVDGNSQGQCAPRSSQLRRTTSSPNPLEADHRARSRHTKQTGCGGRPRRPPNSYPL